MVAVFDDVADDQLGGMRTTLSSIDLPKNVGKMIWGRIKSMILKTGKTFSMVCDDELRPCSKFLVTRQDHVTKCDSIYS